MGSGPIQMEHTHGGEEISIHAPRMGSDGAKSFQCLYRPSFLSTPPAWGATYSAGKAN